MTAWPDTRQTLLARLHDPNDQQAWEEFVHVYGPLIFRVARRRGLQPADADDITQKVLVAIAQAACDWEQGNTAGRLRGWLSRVTTNAALNLLARDVKHRGSADSRVQMLLEQTPDNPELTQVWNEERQKELFRFAAKKVRPKFTAENWSCFWRTAVQNETVESVSQELGKSVGAIYVAKSRVMAHIRKVVEQVEANESWSETVYE